MGFKAQADLSLQMTIFEVLNNCILNLRKEAISLQMTKLIFPPNGVLTIEFHSSYGGCVY